MSDDGDEEGNQGSEHDLKVAVATMYYLDELSKLQIAEALSISRFKVARLLQAAQDQGIVEIRIHEDQAGGAEVSAALKQKFGLLSCVVVYTPRGGGSEESLRSALGAAAAKLLGKVLGERDILGIGWGRSIQEVIPHLPPLPQCPVVQLTGMTGAPDQNSTEIVRRIASWTKGTAFPLYAPLLLPSPETADELKRLPGIATTFGMHERITVALMSIGSWNPPNSQLRVQFSRDDQAELDRLGVRAEVGGVLLNDDGQVVGERQFAGRILAIDGAHLQQIPNVIGVAGGKTKREAIRVAITSRYINSLVTDEETARSLLRGPSPGPTW